MVQSWDAEWKMRYERRTLGMMGRMGLGGTSCRLAWDLQTPTI